MIKIVLDPKVIGQALNDHVKAVKQHFERHIYTARPSKTCWEVVDEWFKNEGGIGFENILSASHEQMLTFVRLETFKRSKYPFPIEDIKLSYEKFSSAGIGGSDKKEKRNGYIFAKALSLTVCPYCNRNYITSLDKRRRRTCQLDHYFNKDTHPYLALSFFNLVPSCGSCNHFKSTEDITFCPFREEDVDHLIKFGYKGSTLEPDKLVLEVTASGDMKKNLEVFGLDELYASHSDYLWEILAKKESYPDTLIDEILRNHGHLYKNRQEVLNVLYANYLRVEEYQKRPLAKLTADILRIPTPSK